MNTAVMGFNPGADSPYALARAAQANVTQGSNIVLVDMHRRGNMNAFRPEGRGHTLMPEFEIMDEHGNRHKKRFRDASGKVFSPRLPYPVDTSTEHGRTLLSIFNLYKLFIEPKLVIHNPIKKAQEDVQNTDLMLEALSKLKALRDAGDMETLTNMLRRLEGPVGSKTSEVVIATLSRIAQLEPRRIMKLDVDPNFEQKVLIDKAIEAKRLIEKNGYYYYPEAINEGRLIAEGEDKLILSMRSNRELQDYFKQAAELLKEQPLTAVVTSIPRLTDEQREALAELDDLGDMIDEEDETDGLGNDDIEMLTEPQTRALVQKAMANGFLEDDSNGKYKAADNTFRTPLETESWYVVNGRAAEALRLEMSSQGMA